MLNISTLKRSERIAIHNAIGVGVTNLTTIYREETSPALTVTRFVEAVGIEAAQVTIASLVNERGTFDGRISRQTREWAASIDGALDEQTAQEWGIYTDAIHPAHLEQIAQAMIRYTPTDPTDPTDEPTDEQPTEQASEIAPDHITLDGITMPAEWSVSSTGRSAWAFYELDGERFRVAFTGRDHGDLFVAAWQAAKQGTTTQVNTDDLMMVMGEAKVLPQRRQAADKAADKPTAPNPDKQRHGEVPEKWFIGQALEGKNWRIVFDGDAGKTRVCFPRKPSTKVLEAVKAAGFYWSPAMQSWNKGLNFRAYRAAEKLHAQLHALTA